VEDVVSSSTSIRAGTMHPFDTGRSVVDLILAAILLRDFEIF
jgi:hypothetical protein